MLLETGFVVVEPENDFVKRVRVENNTNNTKE